MKVKDLRPLVYFKISGIWFRIIEHKDQWTICTDRTGATINLLNMEIDQYENTQTDRDPA